jgi:hypothetical protein
MDMMSSRSDQEGADHPTNAVKLSEFRTAVRRLPVTVRPSINQQLSEWDSLFPYERRRLVGFMKGIESFSRSELDELLIPLRKLEVKMGVESWNFSESGTTLENASMLARSVFYADWRREVQRVFDAIEAAATQTAPSAENSGRIVLIFLPANLPVSPPAIWQPWDPRAQTFDINGDSASICELALSGTHDQPGIHGLLAAQGSADSSSIWLIDSEATLGNIFHPDRPPSACVLNYATLKPFRDEFLAEVNTIPKDLQATDLNLTALRRKDWTPFCPSELAGQSLMRDFVIDLFLSGNGALIFSNAFVEWAASEALRRARPRALIARFGMRSKPKPFTSIAIFENQQRITTLPDTDDPQGSAIDALELARYIWLAAMRYPEGEQTSCLCISENCNSAYLIASQEKSPGWNTDRSVTPPDIVAWIRKALT